MEQWQSPIRAILLSCLLLVCSSSRLWGTPPPPELEPYLDNGGYLVQRNGEVLAQYRSEELFIPASTIKLLSLLAAYETLGAEYRFITTLYIDQQGTLYIKGSGDPLFTSESLQKIAAELGKLDITQINRYVLDDSIFQLEHSLPDGSENSHNPYDAPNNGLGFNFNSVPIQKRNNGEIRSGEPQTPTLPIMEEIGGYLPAGEHRINIASFPLKSDLAPSLQYLAQALHMIISSQNISSTLQVEQGIVPTDATVLYQYRSDHTLQAIIQGCLRHSTNFTANQLILAAGAHRYGKPATWAKAQKLMLDFGYNRLKISPEEIQLVEGSGLSRQNSITPAAMIKVLEGFQPYRQLMSYKFGTRIKSGTMKSIHCYAGYHESKLGTVLFALFQNQTQNSRDKLLRGLQQLYFDQKTPSTTGPLTTP